MQSDTPTNPPEYLPKISLNAAVFISISLRLFSPVYAPLVISARAVSVHISTVSIKTSTMPHIPCTALLFSLDAACTMADEPSPASLEKTPLATPVFTALLTLYPAAPPITGFMPNAQVIISFMQGSMLSQFAIIVVISAAIKISDTAGISFSVNEAMRLIPPMIIKPDIVAVTIPTESGAILPLWQITPAIALLCVILPIPSDAPMQSTAKTQATLRLENAFSIYAIEPPAHSFLSFFVRCSMLSTFSAQQVISPSRADITIQNTAPAPPALSAAATPIMLPVPMQAASAEESAAMGEIPSDFPLFLRLPNVERNIKTGCLN